MASFKCTFASAIFDQDMTLRKFLAEIPQNEDIAAIELIVLSRIHKLQWEDSKIYQILPMDPGKLSGKNDTKSKVTGRQRGMLAAGSLTVVATSHHGMSVGSIESLRSLPIGPVQHVEGEFGDLRDVAAERQGSGSGRHDLIGRNIIAYLQ